MSNRRVAFAELVTAKLPQETAPVQQAAPVSYTPQPLYRTGAVRQAGAGHSRVTHEVSDEILRTLEVYT